MNRLEKAAAFGAMMGKLAGLGSQSGVGEMEKVVKPVAPPVNPGIALETPRNGPNEWNPEFFGNAARFGAAAAPSLAGAGAAAASSLTRSPVLGMAARAASPLVGAGASRVLGGAAKSIDSADFEGHPIIKSMVDDAKRSAPKWMGITAPKKPRGRGQG